MSTLRSTDPQLEPDRGGGNGHHGGDGGNGHHGNGGNGQNGGNGRHGDLLSAELRALAEDIAHRRARVGVIGQGYVGFALAQETARAGFQTYGLDVSDAALARCLDRNQLPNYQAGRALEPLDDCAIIVVAVPTPTRADGHERAPDLSFVLGAVSTLTEVLRRTRRPRLVIFESTYAPGTTRAVVAPLLAQGRLGIDLAFGYSPERIDPGNTSFALDNTPKVTSGYDAPSAELTALFYSCFAGDVLRATSMEAAEATKMLENTYRFINIAFAQEFDQYCETVGLRAREIVELASTKPFGFQPFFAGTGIGGSCIAEDPYFLAEAMAAAGAEHPILQAGLRNHEARARVIVQRIAAQLGPAALRGARLLLLGVSYKPGVSEARLSPVEPVLKLLEAAGALVDYADPHVPEFAGRRAVDWESTSPARYDLAVLLTEHAELDPERLRARGWRLCTATDRAAVAPPRASRAVAEPV